MSELEKNGTNSNSGEAVRLFVLPALVIALFELFLGASVCKSGMSLPEVISKMYEEYLVIILLLYTVVSVVLFPMTISFFHRNGKKLRQYFFRKEGRWKDILLGVLAGIVPYTAVTLIYDVMIYGSVAGYGDKSMLPLDIISTVFVSGFFKEIYFRGIPYIFLKDKMGEWPAFLLGNLCFAILDWPNLGLSFLLGGAWYLFYRKRGSLIIPVIAHGLYNLLIILGSLGAFHFLGLVVK